MKKVSETISLAGKSLKSIVKIALQSRPVSAPARAAKPGNSVVVLGNGPSLNKTIAEFGDRLREMPSIAVNFMANAPQFKDLKPDYYVMADPHFFNGLENENVKNLWHELSAVEWPMTLCVPARYLSVARKLTGDKNRNLRMATFNFIGAEGFAFIEKAAYDRRVAMPRPRNVLIPAIMCGIYAGYNEIYVTGADHSWMETLRVNDNNNVVSVQPHFYADSKAELKRSETEYKGYRLHDILQSFYIAFRSYHTLRRYADRKGINIYNSTPGSYIDAFQRKNLQ